MTEFARENEGTAAVRDLLWRPTHLALMVVLAVAFFGLYTFFDLREGGREADLGTTRLATPGFYVETFGAAWFYGSVALNLLLALLSAALVVLGLALCWEHRSGAGVACSVTAPALLGFATFGCPGCVMPLAGSLGASFFATSLPLLGLEFKLVSLAVVGAALFWMAHRIRDVEDLKSQT